jgi:hypothetical protein
MADPKTDPPPPLDGEVLPPQTTYEEVAAFLEKHGQRMPRPKSYSSLKAAMRAIAIEEGLSGPE